MNSYNTFDLRIKKIKATIDDIRGDLENLKNVPSLIKKEKRN